MSEIDEFKTCMDENISTFGKQLLIMNLNFERTTQNDYRYCFEVLNDKQEKIGEFALDDGRMELLRDVVDTYFSDKERKKFNEKQEVAERLERKIDGFNNHPLARFLKG